MKWQIRPFNYHETMCEQCRESRDTEPEQPGGVTVLPHLHRIYWNYSTYLLWKKFMQSQELFSAILAESLVYNLSMLF